MKPLTNLLMWPIRAVLVFAAISTIILMYSILQQYEYAQYIALFILLVLGFGTDHWRTRKLNSKIHNPYHNGKR